MNLNLTWIASAGEKREIGMVRKQWGPPLPPNLYSVNKSRKKNGVGCEVASRVTVSGC